MRARYSLRPDGIPRIVGPYDRCDAEGHVLFRIPHHVEPREDGQTASLVRIPLPRSIMPSLGPMLMWVDDEPVSAIKKRFPQYVIGSPEQAAGYMTVPKAALPYLSIAMEMAKAKQAKPKRNQ